MDIDNNLPLHYDSEPADDEVGSDELLSDDNLRLPESANILVRLHAVQAWLSRRYDEATIEVGNAALGLQEVMQEDQLETRVRRRMRIGEDSQRFIRVQQALAEAQQRQSAYEEAQTILEDCVAHTSGERVLVEYYLTLEELILRSLEQVERDEDHAPWLEAMSDVLHRVEHVGTPDEE